jgi:tetratricopeptide (TPR) repeat protein
LEAPSVTVKAFSTCRSLVVLLCVSFCTTSRPLAAQSSPDDAAENAASRPGDAGTTKSYGSQAGSDREPPQEALDHYDLGRRYYLAGRYREALTELKQALDLDRDAPDLLYNVARVYENLNELDEAIAYYQRYLEHVPLASMEERERTEKTIRRLHGAKQASPPTRAPATIVRQAPASSHFGRADLAFWITSGAGIALLAGGATCGVLAIRKYDAVGDFVVGADGSFDKRQSLSDEAKRFALFADGLFVASGLALTSAALLFLLRDAEQPKPQAGAWHFGLNVAGPAAQLSVTRHF